MGQPVTNIGNRRPDPPSANPDLPPPEVAVAQPSTRRTDWRLTAIGLAVICAFCYFAEQILVVILISVLLAFILAPVAEYCMRLRMPRSVAAGISVLLMLLLLGAAGYYGVNQAVNLLQELPKYSVRVRQEIAKISSKTRSLEVLSGSDEKGAIQVREATSVTDLLRRSFGSATEIVLAASFIPFLVFFMLTWQEHARAATVGLFPLEHRREAHAALGMIAAMVRSFMIGNLMIALLIGGISTVVFALLHVPFFYFVGFASGFLSLVPYLGAVLSALPALFLGVGHLSLADVGWIFLTSVSLHIVAMNVLYPKMLGSRLRLNPLAVTIALLVWALLWGAMGLLLAVPITAGMKIVFDHVESLKPLGAWLGEDSARNGNGKSGR
ncbi:MAG TPA: AI-2E family transporter [Bryobacteraceae bacterium]